MRMIIYYKKEELKEAEDMKKNFDMFNKLAKKSYLFEIQEEKENV